MSWKLKLSFLLLFLSTFSFLLSPFYFSPAQAAPLEAKDIDLHTWTGVNGLDTASAINCQLSGWDVTKPDGSGCPYYDEGGRLAMADKPGGGAIGAVGNLIGALYQPPASSIQYLAYLKQNLGLVTPVYAQVGGGFRGLSYLLPLWRGFRNAAYLVFILAFVITGLLIMFRIRVSPQAVATLQNSLPRLLITFILITLSYAIVGLMIDLMYVIIYLILNIIGRTPGVNLGNLTTTFQNYNVFSYWSEGASLGFDSITKPAQGISDIVDSITGHIFILSGLLSTGAKVLAWAIFTIAILWALFRLLFILIKAYVWVLVLLIFGPFQLLLGALPGGGGSFGISGWVRSLLANLAVFPATITMFALASAFLQLARNVAVTNQWSAPLIGGQSIDAVQALIGLGIILTTPSVAQMMNDAFKPPPFPYGAALGAALGAGPALAGGVTRRIGAATGYELGPGQKATQRWRRPGFWLGGG